MIRAAGVAVTISALMLHGAAGDEIRRTSFASTLLGKWALSAERCDAKDKSNIVISKSKYITPDSSCDVEWIVETAGSRGQNYSVHARCIDASEPKKTSTTNLIIRPQGDDRILIGKSFDDLKAFLRCQTR